MKKTITESEISRLKNWAKKIFDDNHKDFEVLDFDAKIDKAITYEENKAALREEMTKLMKIPSKHEAVTKEKYDVLVDIQLKAAEEQAEKEFQNALEKIQHNQTTDFIEEIYYVPKQFAKMVANRNSRGFILWGETGLGKSYSVIKAFREVGKSFAYLTGHITPLEFYQFLYEHKTEDIILDDVNILDSIINLNMLKSALNENSGLVSYNTSSNKLKVPSKFSFEGTITLLVNSKPRSSEDMRAVESRVLTYELKMGYKQKIKIIYELAKQDYRGLNQDDRNTIVEWIKKNTSSATENLNLRLLFQLYEIYKFDKENWEKLAEKLIVNDMEISLILQGAREDEWCKMTGHHRATYYRHKKELEAEITE